MENLTLKYRPKKFEDVVGQDNIVAILKKQIESHAWKSAYLFTGAFGCGKTTMARIISNEINKTEGSAIEIDGASNNGVDNVRALIEDAQQKSLDCDYKLYIVDECLTGDVEVLTDKGFVRFDKLSHSELIAQYKDDGSIEFVEPLEYICKKYSGEMKVWEPKFGHKVKMTPNHVQPLYYAKSKKIKEKYIKDVKFSQSNYLIMSGKGVSVDNKNLSAMDRLAIASQADGTLQYCYQDYNYWTIHLKKQKKIERIINLFKESKVEWKEIKTSRDGLRRFSYKTPVNITKKLGTYFSIPHSYEYARDFVREISLWDGWTYGEKNIGYDSVIEENANLVASIAVQGGYTTTTTRKINNRNENFKDIYRTYMVDSTMRNSSNIKDSCTTEEFNGNVYCVKVPSQKIIVRANGSVFITGNCHMLSTAAWNAALKLIEEPPENCIFIFCTTDPQKLPRTILSRVQRFDFGKIDTRDIVKRLSYIANKEGIVNVEEEALKRLAMLADGHMRDAIKYLQQVMEQCGEVTTYNVDTIFGLVEQAALTNLFLNIKHKLASDVYSRIEEVDKRGVNMVQFYDAFTDMIMDCLVYATTKNSTLVDLPNEVMDNCNDRNALYRLVGRLITYRKDVNNSNAKAMLKLIVAGEL